MQMLSSYEHLIDSSRKIALPKRKPRTTKNTCQSSEIDNEREIWKEPNEGFFEMRAQKNSQRNLQEIFASK